MLLATIITFVIFVIAMFALVLIRQDEYDFNFPQFVVILSIVFLIICGIVQPVSINDGKQDCVAFEQQYDQLTDAIENIDVVDSHFLKHLYDGVYEYNVLVKKRQYRATRWFNAGYVTKRYLDLQLIDISKLPRSATIGIYVEE